VEETCGLNEMTSFTFLIDILISVKWTSSNILADYCDSIKEIVDSARSIKTEEGILERGLEFMPQNNTR
jgi:hypothetical protein